jgi:hypothetical protein
MATRKSKATSSKGGPGEDRPLKTMSAPKPAPPAAGTIFQLKITLEGIRPPVWRRVQVEDCSLADLHDIIQVSMGWENSHLHAFEIGGEQYGDRQQWEGPGGWGEPEVKDSRKLKLGRLVAQGIKKFRYVYDMGDSWTHTLLVEKTVPAEPASAYPRCTDGKRACPPEDCGGPWGYGSLLETLGDPKHPEHDEMLEWVGGKFDPEAFAMDAVNERLKRLR